MPSSASTFSSRHLAYIPICFSHQSSKDICSSNVVEIWYCTWNWHRHVNITKCKTIKWWRWWIEFNTCVGLGAITKCFTTNRNRLPTFLVTFMLDGPTSNSQFLPLLALLLVVDGKYPCELGLLFVVILQVHSAPHKSNGLLGHEANSVCCASSPPKAPALPSLRTSAFGCLCRAEAYL